MIGREQVIYSHQALVKYKGTVLQIKGGFGNKKLQLPTIMFNVMSSLKIREIKDKK